MSPTTLLSKPPGPGWMRKCPQCRRWFALKYQETSINDQGVRVKVFGCRSCGAQIEFAKRHPPKAV